MATKNYADGDGTKWVFVPYFMTGCNRLAFNKVWSVRRVLKPRERYTYGADSVGGTLYEYGELPPNHSVPATTGHCEITGNAIFLEHADKQSLTVSKIWARHDPI